MLSNPGFGGGIRPTVDVFRAYLKSEFNNTRQLIDYALKLGNGAVFKRLGFLLERYAPSEEESIASCKTNLTKGNAMLDPALSSDRLITRWRLWVPQNWKEERNSD